MSSSFHVYETPVQIATAATLPQLLESSVTAQQQGIQLSFAHVLSWLQRHIGHAEKKKIPCCQRKIALFCEHAIQLSILIISFTVRSELLYSMSLVSKDHALLKARKKRQNQSRLCRFQYDVDKKCPFMKDE